MNTCSTCKWWGGDEYDADAPPGYKTCTNDRLGDSAYYSDSDMASPVEYLFDDALTCAWHEMGAPITGPKFGCVHHEERK